MTPCHREPNQPTKGNEPMTDLEKYEAARATFEAARDKLDDLLHATDAEWNEEAVAIARAIYDSTRKERDIAMAIYDGVDPMSLLVHAVRQHAAANYTKGGWDIIVECWSNAEIADAIGGAKTEAGAIRNVAKTARMLGDYRSDIQNA